MYPVAVLSDIHGNRWALEAVLEDIDSMNIRRVFNLGDSVYGPLDPSGTASLLRRTSILSVCGNEDRILSDTSPGEEMSATIRYVTERLDSGDMAWLRGLRPIEYLNDGMTLFHGTPDSDEAYLIYSTQPTGLQFRSVEQVEVLIADHPGTMFLCGHDHRPNVITLSEDRMVVNPGSVGLQAYDDDKPICHAIENGSPHARYCVIHREEQGWRIESVAVPYDFLTASETARENNRPDWAHWLKTGFARQPA